MIVCKCLVCGATWEYPDGTDEGFIRAGSAPCGHQGLFEVKNKGDTPLSNPEEKKKEMEKEMTIVLDGKEKSGMSCLAFTMGEIWKGEEKEQ